jgi:DNA-binding LytR/AlgR family response regulator
MKVLIIEDEINAMERLRKMVHDIVPGATIVGNCESITQTLHWLSTHEAPDVILSDVQLTDGLSFEIFAQIGKKIPVIFISAYDQYAIEAFKAEGLHYLLKPLKKEELAVALDRYIHKSSLQHATSNKLPVSEEEAQKYQERFVVHVGNKMLLVAADEIAYAYSENKLTYLITYTLNKYVVDMTLEKLEHALNPLLFYRINRQCIVQLKSIVKMQPASKQRIALTLEPLPKFETTTSFERTPNFKRWLLGDIDFVK